MAGMPSAIVFPFVHECAVKIRDDTVPERQLACNEVMMLQQAYLKAVFHHVFCAGAIIVDLLTTFWFIIIIIISSSSSSSSNSITIRPLQSA